MLTNPSHPGREPDGRPRLRPVRSRRVDDADPLDRLPDEQPPLLLTVAQAAQRLGVGRSLLYELMATGELQSIHVRRLRRIPADEITAYIARLRSRAPRTGRG